MTFLRQDPVHMSLDSLLYPRAIAVYGASRSLDKFGGRVLHNLIRNGFVGELIPVNRDGGEVQGRISYNNLGGYMGPVDAAVLAVPNTSVLAAAEECAAAGVGSVVVIGTGFAETDEAGRVLQQSLLEICRAGSMRLLGPNCLGAINPFNRMVLTSSISATVGALPAPGRIGFVSQSGALMVSMFDYARQAQIGLGPCISVGNQADIEICDVIEHLAADPNIDAICVYAEGFKDPNRFLLAARMCQANAKSLLLAKAGRTQAGAKAAQSHTASLAGSYAVTAAVCRENGVVIAHEPISMLMAAALMSGRMLPASDGVAICSGSGGSITIAVDEMEGADMRLADLSPATEAALEAHVVAGHTHNPIDLGFRRVADPIAAAGPIMSTLAADDDVGWVLLLLGSVPGLEAMTKALLRPILDAGKLPLIVVDAGEIADAARRAAVELDCPAFPSLELALRAAHLVNQSARLNREAEKGAAALPPVNTALDNALAALPPGYLPEPEAKALLTTAGIVCNSGEVAADADAAIAFAERTGYPVVLKVASRDVIHKSASGGVRVNLAGPEEVRAAFAAIIAAVGSAARMYVQQMVRGAVAELLLGLRVDPQFGPVVLVASGGTLTETLDDAQLSTAPVSRERAHAMLQGLRLWPTLERLARTQAVDLEAVVTAIERMGWLAVAARERLADLESNPLLVMPDGAGPIAVDARANVIAAVA